MKSSAICGGTIGPEPTPEMFRKMCGLPPRLVLSVDDKALICAAFPEKGDGALVMDEETMFEMVIRVTDLTDWSVISNSLDTKETLSALEVLKRRLETFNKAGPRPRMLLRAALNFEEGFPVEWEREPEMGPEPVDALIDACAKAIEFTSEAHRGNFKKTALVELTGRLAVVYEHATGKDITQTPKEDGGLFDHFLRACLQVLFPKEEWVTQRVNIREVQKHYMSETAPRIRGSLNIEGTPDKPSKRFEAEVFL